MLTLNLFDNNFTSQVCSVANQTPKTFRYVRNQMEWDGITLFTDARMFDGSPETVHSRHKVGWLHEGIELRRENYTRARAQSHLFDGILTTEEMFWGHDKKFWPTIRGGCWIPEDRWGLYPKQKSVSMIISDKVQLSGHKLRWETSIDHPEIDVFGPSFSPIGTDKSLAYRDYRFAVVIEASRRDNWFSEHLLDCIAYGTIPIYWGCPNIGMYLNAEGILPFKRREDLADLMPYLTESLYEYMLPHARENLAKMKDYIVTEDWFVTNVLEPHFDL